LTDILSGGWVIFASIFILISACYFLYSISGGLEIVGAKLGKLLKLPDVIIASTFLALATSGPEIVMAILSSTDYIQGAQWESLQIGERACSGTLNMAFSAMDNLLGIGCVAICYMIYKGQVKANDVVPIKVGTVMGLFFYMISSFLLSIFISDGILTYKESWTLAWIAIVFIFSQLFSWIYTPYLSGLLKLEVEEDEDDDITALEPGDSYIITLVHQIGIYCILIFGLVVFVRLCLGATFNLATLGIVSVGGILLAFTSYVSSFPEFMIAFRYVVANKKDAILALLFGSNVIDLGFAGFRSMWLHQDMQVYTTGKMPQLLSLYIWALPSVALCLLFAFLTKKFKWGHAQYLVLFYCFYIISGFILL
jgi:Ca2+/Na+ antiporter